MNAKEKLCSSLLPSHFNDGAEANPRTEEFEQFSKSYLKFISIPEGKGHAGDLRRLTRSFIRNGSNRPAGDTNVTTQGLSLLGDRPKTTHQTAVLTFREIATQAFNEASINALKDISDQRGHTTNSDYSFSSMAEASFQVELEEAGKKGPYDNSTPSTATQAINNILDNASEYAPLEDWAYEVLDVYFDELAAEYKEHMTESLSEDLSGYADMIAKSGLKSTMRGAPYFAPGNSKISLHHIVTAKFMFNKSKHMQDWFDDNRNLTMKNESGEEVPITVDDHIQMVLNQLQTLDNLVEVMTSLNQLIQSTISRDQGSPYDAPVELDKIQWTYERKARKYRAVVPAAAYVQAIISVVLKPLVNAAPKLSHRIGLQSPDINDRRMNQYIRESYLSEFVLLSTDYSAYDTRLMTPLLALQTAAYKRVTDNQKVHDVIDIATVAMTQKMAVLPTQVNSKDTSFSKFPHIPLHRIKGDGRVNLLKYSRMTSDDRIKEKLKQEADESDDYMVQLFHIYKGWLISGIILTNTTGSDITKALAILMLNCFLRDGLITDEEYQKGRTLIISSGDDCVMPIPKRLYDDIGYMKILEYIQEYAHRFNMDINASKQLRVKINGYPVVDFLQHVYEWTDKPQKPYKKFVRQWMGIPYTERFSKLDPISGMVQTVGKAESGLCEQNLDLAVELISLTGIKLSQMYKKKRMKPRPTNRRIGKTEFFDIQPYTPINSQYAGLGPLIYLTQKYGQGTLSALGKHAANSLETDELIANLESELETRAPHKQELARELFSSLGKDAYDYAGGDNRFDGTTTHHWLFVDVLNRVYARVGERIPPLELISQPDTGAVDTLSYEEAHIDEQFTEGE